jgi:murein DD-endopeptidase MepM/ murein hydrolase activator NlpD
MLHRAPVRVPAGHGHPVHPGYDGVRAQPKVQLKQLPDRSGWTLGHGDRQVRVGPVAFWIIVGSLVVMAGWSAVTATYFAFRDDVLTRILSRQAQMQFAYEDRIADLRGQVDRLASRQLLDQEQFESKLDQIARRQAMLEGRSTTLPGLADPTPTGSIKGGPRGAPASGTPKPSPINDTVAPSTPADRDARMGPASIMKFAGLNTATGIESALAKLEESLDRYEIKQAKNLNALEESYDAKARKLRSVLVELGMDVSKIAPAPAPQRATGGPFVLASANSVSTFDKQAFRIKQARGSVDRLTRALTTVPIRKPMSGELDYTSSFGMRRDPFVRSFAMHTGLDFRADTGEAVRATAAGSVAHAGWNGGYGKMVEIDHGNGFTTRYAHLSAIDVEVGQSVRIGQIVGKVGSTGRSTGPHLHYETRVDGDPVDPQKFLRAGVRLNGAF